jgi:hypothetical protein
VHGWGRHREVLLHVCFCRSAAMELGVGINEREVLALEFGKAIGHGELLE